MSCRHRPLHLGLSLALLLVASMPSHAQIKVAVTPDRETGIYELGDTVTWTIRVTDGDQPATGDVNWFVRRGGLVQISQGTATLADGTATVEATRDDPGALLLSARYNVGDERTEGLGGAVYAPDQITASADEPADFDEFWQGKIAALAAIPPNPQLTLVDLGEPEIEYYKLEMDGWNGSKIYAQLAKPKGGTNLPAMVVYQWAGVYGLNRDWVTGLAKNGWLALNVMAHDLPIDQPSEFYKAQDEGPLRGYPTQGRDDRETSYFLRMYLAVYRTLDYMTTRPDWNQETLAVQGSSQGGGQSLIAAGIHPRVTALLANVPAMCDHAGHLVGRAPGWPRLAGWGQEPDSAQVVEVGKYFDAVYFARRAKAQSALVSTGLIDVTCSPEGVIAAFNALPVPNKELVLMPLAGHNGGQDAYYQRHGSWLWQLRDGRVPER